LHARTFARIEGCELAAVYDANREVCEEVARRHGARAARTLEEFAGLVDVAAVCTPTITHHSIGLDLLRRGKHLLIEKPIADTPARARELSEAAAAAGCVLQVGHIERFNPVLAALEERLCNPRFLEVTRLSPYPNRSTDIGVVLDLMIHDLEVILHLVRSPLADFDAVGIAVLGGGEDIANVRLRFENGCVANVTASRISQDRLRKIRVFQENAYLSLDYKNQSGYLLRLAEEGERESSALQKLASLAADTRVVFEVHGRRIVREPVPVRQGDPLTEELRAFLECARSGRSPKVSGWQAAAALDLAMKITARIEAADPRKSGGGPVD
ncbi:MAG: Gfo/Idh/MocA family oxidoreductase, partial [Terrimicrobiaceae bacterium]|nr:Gfo/Idh/MocA family oxidoreductase [Terrimicrobiaceae bacterium]